MLTSKGYALRRVILYSYFPFYLTRPTVRKGAHKSAVHQEIKL